MPGRSACSPDRRAEAGISLIEVLVAMAILSGVLLALGGLMVQTVRHSRTSAAVGFRAAAITTAASWAAKVPFDSIDVAVGCTADSTGRLLYSRCVSVRTPTARQKEITVVISPTGALTAVPDTIVVRRTKPRPPSPFSLP